jgi:hypothetical protein
MNEETLPVFALMYEFKKDYITAELENSFAEHESYADKFRRIFLDEEIKAEASRGYVMFFHGLNENDLEATRNEAKQFVENDPLILQDLVLRWNIVQMNPFTPGLEDSALMPGQ